MKTNEKYYQRVIGDWYFTVTFKIISLKGLLFSSINWTHKVRTIAMLFNQMLFGKFAMQTQIEFDLESGKARHFLQLTKWGFTFYRSEKRLILDGNGFDLCFDGEEYFWPLLSRPETFRSFKGHVNENFTSATYQWPLFNLPFHCQTLLDKDQGLILLDAGWLQCKFKMTENSIRKLNQI